MMQQATVTQTTTGTTTGTGGTTTATTGAATTATSTAPSPTTGVPATTGTVATSTAVTTTSTVAGPHIPDRGFPAAAGWILLVFVGILGAYVLWRIVTRKINLDDLLNEPGANKASLSRLQFLIFTFVISLSLFYVITRCTCETLPDIPAGFFILLGISGGTYAIARGVDGQVRSEQARAVQEQAKAEQARAEVAKAALPR